MAKPSFKRLGTPIDVSNVQALAASIANPADVPPRDVRPEAKADPVASVAEIDLPVIDFSRLLHRRFSREENFAGGDGEESGGRTGGVLYYISGPTAGSEDQLLSPLSKS
ncbi:unnamed protein product [Musa hybrid cultivar]